MISLLLAAGVGIMVGGVLTLGWRSRRGLPRAEAALSRARAILNALPDTWLTIDPSEQIREVHLEPRPNSDRALALLRGQSIDTFFSPEVGNKLRAARNRCAAERTEQTVEFDLKIRGEVRTVEARLLPLFEREALVVMRDISDRKVTERGLHQALTLAESMLEARTQAFARLGHDVNNQMTGVLSIADALLLREGGLGSSRPYLETIQRCSETIVQLVRDMGDLTRIERGALALRPTQIDLEAVLSDCLSIVRPSCREGVKLGFSFANANTPRHIETDETRLRQVIVNLLHNATKFTVQGEVAVSVQAPDEDSILLTVSDTGPGIPADERLHIFDAYYQGSEQRRTETGTGLGLAIVHSLSRIMGGEVSVESQPGEGTAFHVRLPRRPPTNIPCAPPSIASAL